MGSGPFGNVTVSGGTIGGLLSANNLSDVDNPTASLNNILPSQIGNTGKTLLTNGANASWQNVAGGSSSWGAITGTLASQTDLQNALDLKKTDSVSDTNKLLGRFSAGSGVMEEISLGTNLSITGGILNAASGGLSSITNVLYCYTGGSYATLQDAVNAASDYTVIYVAPKTGSWGDVVLPAQKRIHIIGLQSPRGISVEVNSITFSPTSGLNININQCFIQNLFINQITGTSQAVIFGGTNPGRLRFEGCYINASNGSVPLISISNSNNTSGVYFEYCLFDAGSSGTRSNISLSASVYTRIRNSDLSGGSKCIIQSAGTIDATDVNFECNQVNEVINLSGGNSYIGSTSIVNTTTNGSGFLMVSPAFLSLGNSGFAVNTGTGYCLRGTGTVFYDRYIFSDTVALVQNKKVQNTLAIFQYTSTASVVA